jgi:DNA-binding MarR family transcriptional regulator
MSLRDEIKQQRPFRSLEEEVALNLLRTANALAQGLAAPLRETALTGTQYNVLRILRGAGKNGLPCGEIAARMITKDPDITRLLDRLQKRGVVARERDPGDRRVVVTRITREGLKLLAELDQPMVETLERLLGHLGPRKLRQLATLLEEARANVPGD